MTHIRTFAGTGIELLAQFHYSGFFPGSNVKFTILDVWMGALVIALP